MVGADSFGGAADSGARGTRTPALSAASRTLSQLSYGPAELELGCPV